MSKIVLYGALWSPPVRAVLLTLKALEIAYEIKAIDLFKRENYSDEFLKHNPQHTVPVLDDNGTWIWDSHAISSYLVSKYGKDDSLYPKDLAKRAVVDQRLFFDASILFISLKNIVKPLVNKNITVVMKQKTEDIIEGYEFLETFLADNPYITGETLTIADFCCAATISSLRGVVEIEPARFPKILDWLERLSKLPYFEEANEIGVKQLFGLLKSKLKEIII